LPFKISMCHPKIEGGDVKRINVPRTHIKPKRKPPSIVADSILLKASTTMTNNK